MPAKTKKSSGNKQAQNTKLWWGVGILSVIVGFVVWSRMMQPIDVNEVRMANLNAKCDRAGTLSLSYGCGNEQFQRAVVTCQNSRKKFVLHSLRESSAEIATVDGKRIPKCKSAQEWAIEAENRCATYCNGGKNRPVTSSPEPMPSPVPLNQVRDYDSCTLATGSYVYETYPGRCTTSDGRSFVQVIGTGNEPGR